MKKSAYFLPAITAFVFVSCRSDVAPPADTQAPVVTITAPATNQNFTSGQTVTVAASITDNNAIDEVHLEITNTSTGTFITHEHFVPDAATYTLSRTFTLPAANYQIKVEAEDKNSNDAQSVVTIKVN